MTDDKQPAAAQFRPDDSAAASGSANAARKLSRDFYALSTLVVARQLIGTTLVHQDGNVRRAGRIVETEAYLGPTDLAAHSSKGRTERNAVMFGPAGHAYVYFIYGFWNCVNVVTREEGVPQAVLIRALEPVEGLTDKTWGPGLLCRAMNIDRRLNGADLCGSTMWIEPRESLSNTRRPNDQGPNDHGLNGRGSKGRGSNERGPRRWNITRATRIGVDYAGDWALRLWRFHDRDSPFVSTASAAARKRFFTHAAMQDAPRAAEETNGKRRIRRSASTPGSRKESVRPSRR